MNPDTPTPDTLYPPLCLDDPVNPTHVLVPIPTDLGGVRRTWEQYEIMTPGCSWVVEPSWSAAGGVLAVPAALGEPAVGAVFLGARSRPQTVRYDLRPDRPPVPPSIVVTLPESMSPDEYRAFLADPDDAEATDPLRDLIRFSYSPVQGEDRGVAALAVVLDLSLARPFTPPDPTEPADLVSAALADWQVGDALRRLYGPLAIGALPGSLPYRSWITAKLVELAKTRRGITYYGNTSAFEIWVSRYYSPPVLTKPAKGKRRSPAFAPEATATTVLLIPDLPDRVTGRTYRDAAAVRDARWAQIVADIDAVAHSKVCAACGGRGSINEGIPQYLTIKRN